MELTVKINNALNALVLNPSIITATVVDKLLWKYHKEVASRKGISTDGQWFRTLISQEPSYETQRDAIEILLQVIKYGTATEVKQVMKSEHIAPLVILGDVFDDFIAKKMENNTHEDTI